MLFFFVDMCLVRGKRCQVEINEEVSLSRFHLFHDSYNFFFWKVIYFFTLKSLSRCHRTWPCCSSQFIIVGFCLLKRLNSEQYTSFIFINLEIRQSFESSEKLFFQTAWKNIGGIFLTSKYNCFPLSINLIQLNSNFETSRRFFTMKFEYSMI